MAQLTAEIIRTIVQEEVGDVRNEMRQEFATVRREMKQEFENVYQEFANVRQEVADGLNQVIATMQSFYNQDQDEQAGLNRRLRNHNERIAKLERLAQLRL